MENLIVFLIMAILFCIWPGSLYFIIIKHNLNCLHGHTSNYCKKHECKHCKLWRIKGTKGIYDEYRCDRPYCIIDNRGKEEYDLKIMQEQQHLMEIDKKNKATLALCFENNKNINDIFDGNMQLFVNHFDPEYFAELIKKFPDSNITIESFLEINTSTSFVYELVEKLLKVNNVSFNEVFEIILKTDKKRSRYNNYYLELLLLSVNYKNFYFSEGILNHTLNPIEINLEDSKITNLLFFNLENLRFFNKLNQKKFRIRNINYGFDIFLKLDYEQKKLFTECIVEKHIYNYDNRNVFINKVLNTGDFGLYELLFRKNNNVDTFFKENSYIIFDAIMNCDNDMLEWFKAKKICLNVRNADGITPLIYAIIKNDRILMEYILESNIDINYPDEDGDRPLDYLCYYKRIYLIKKFYRMNARLSNPNSNKMIENAIKENKRFYLPIAYPSYFFRKKTRKS